MRGRWWLIWRAGGRADSTCAVLSAEAESKAGWYARWRWATPMLAKLSVATVGAADCAGRTTLRIWTVWKGKGSGRGWHAKGRSWTTAHLASRPSSCTASFFRALIQPASGGCNGRRQQDGEMARDWALNPCKAAFAVQGDDIVDTSWARCMCQGRHGDGLQPASQLFFFSFFLFLSSFLFIFFKGGVSMDILHRTGGPRQDVLCPSP